MSRLNENTRPNLLPYPICVIDTETTGFVQDEWARLIEIAGVVLGTDGSEIGCFSSLVRPTDTHPDQMPADKLDEALAINRITRDQVRNAPSDIAVALCLHDWLAMYACNHVAAYGASFDREMCSRMGAPITGDNWVWEPCLQVEVTRRMAPDAMRWLEPRGRHTDPIEVGGLLYRPPRLEAAVSFVRDPTGARGTAPFPGRHRALDDARAAAEVLVALRKSP